MPISLDKSPLPVPQTPSQFQHTPSTWTPPSGLLLALDLFMENCRRNIDRLNFSVPLTESNQCPYKLAALCALRSNPGFVMKGGAVVVWRTDLYIAEAKLQFS
eukprot:g36591.t1